MTLTELFSAEASKAIRYLKDLSYLVLSPRKFFRSVTEEPTDQTIHRLTIYASGFAVFEIALLTTVVRETNVGAYAVLAVALLEVVLSLLFLPVFLAVSYFLRIHQPVKVSLSYALSARFLLLIPTMVAYAFFLMTENYAFALVRGVLAYLFLLVHVLLFPLALSRTIARRLFSTLLAIFVLAIISLGMGFLVSQFSTETSKWEQFSLLYDPMTGCKKLGNDWNCSISTNCCDAFLSGSL